MIYAYITKLLMASISFLFFKSDRHFWETMRTLFNVDNICWKIIKNHYIAVNFIKCSALHNHPMVHHFLIFHQISVIQFQQVTINILEPWYIKRSNLILVHFEGRILLMMLSHLEMYVQYSSNYTVSVKFVNS